MIYKRKKVISPYNEIEKKIKEDLVSNFKDKGIGIADINIDLKTGNLNVSLSIK